jgi:hypothetical protein
MLNSGKKIRATKKINIRILVLSEKQILNEAKNHNPPFKLNGRSLTLYNTRNTSIVMLQYRKSSIVYIQYWMYQYREFTILEYQNR